MKPWKSAFLFRAAVCTFLIAGVGTQLLPPASSAAHKRNRYVPWDNVFLNPKHLVLPRRNLSSGSTSRGNGILRVRRSDYANGQVELAGGGPRYIINARPTSQPIMFFDDSNSESHEVKNSMLVIKKKRPQPPQHFTVFTHGSVASQEESLITEYQQPGDPMTSAHVHPKPWKLKTTLSPPKYYQDFQSGSSPPPKYYQDFQSGSSPPKYYQDFQSGSSPPPKYYQDFSSGSTEEKYYPPSTASPKKANTGMSGSVWKGTTKAPGLINNHHPGSYVKPRPTQSPSEEVTKSDEPVKSAVIWKQPTTNMPPSGVISNHNPGSKGSPPWKQPSYDTEHNIKRPHHNLKKPTYSSQASSTTGKFMQLTTAIPHHYPDPPVSSSHFVKKPIPSSFTTTTQSPYFDRFTSGPIINKGHIQRPSAMEIKVPSHRAPSSTSQPIKKAVFQEEENIPQVNNHRPSDSGMIRHRKPLLTSKIHNPSSQVAIVDKHQDMATDIIGQRIKLPETVRSKWMTVHDAPSDRPTTIKHNKLIVVQRRMDKFPQVTQSPSVQDQFTTTVVVTSEPILTLTTKKNIKTATPKPVKATTTKAPDKETFPVAPVIDPWSDVPIPSAPTWAVSSTARPPSLASPSGSSFFPVIPFMPILGSLFSPLLSRPLTPSALNTGMQGIKAMQGFLRNSLMGAMFCFLPSALIAMTMSATQRAELRQIPEINDFMIFCKKCLENLENADKVEFKNEPDWVQNL